MSFTEEDLLIDFPSLTRVRHYSPVVGPHGPSPICGTVEDYTEPSPPPPRRTSRLWSWTARKDSAAPTALIDQATTTITTAPPDQQPSKRKRSSIVDFSRKALHKLSGLWSGADGSDERQQSADILAVADQRDSLGLRRYGAVGRRGPRGLSDASARARPELTPWEEACRLVDWHTRRLEVVGSPFVWGHGQEGLALLDGFRESRAASPATTEPLSDGSSSVATVLIGALMEDVVPGCLGDESDDDDELMSSASTRGWESDAPGRHRNFAHQAWTPVEEFSAGTESRQAAEQARLMRDLEEACMQSSYEGAFDRDVVRSRFESFPNRHTTVEAQESASAEHRRLIAAEASERRAEFERDQARRISLIDRPHPLRSLNETASGVHQRTSGSDVGAAIGETFQRSGGLGF